MADELRTGLSELLRKAMIEQDAEFLKEGIRVLSQALMEMEVEEDLVSMQTLPTVQQPRSNPSKSPEN